RRRHTSLQGDWSSDVCSSDLVLPEAVRRVVRDSYLRDDLTPFDLYIKFLTEYFGPAIEYDPNVESDLPKGVKSLSYQADAVNDRSEERRVGKGCRRT